MEDGFETHRYEAHARRHHDKGAPVMMQAAWLVRPLEETGLDGTIRA